MARQSALSITRAFHGYFSLKIPIGELSAGMLFKESHHMPCKMHWKLLKKVFIGKGI